MGRTLTYGELDRLAPAFRGLPAAGRGAAQGRPHRDHAAERAAVPGRASSARSAPGSRSSTPIRSTRRASCEHQLRDSGARAILILENFAHTLDAVIAATDVDTVIVTGVGDLLAFPKSRDHEFRAAARAQAGAGVLAAGRDPVHGRAEQGHATRTSLRWGLRTRTSRSCSTPAARPASRRAPCSRTATWSRTSCSSRRGSPPTSPEPRTARIVGALPLYHIFALNQALFFMKLGGHNLLIANPARLPGVRERPRGSSASRSSAA